MTKGQKKSEIILYIVLWAILFAAPLLSAFVALHNSSVQTSFDWTDVLNTWKLLAMFFVTFFIHNFLIAPLLVYNNRKWEYGLSLFLLAICFVCYQIYGRPHNSMPREEMKPRGKQVVLLPDTKALKEQNRPMEEFPHNPIPPQKQAPLNFSPEEIHRMDDPGRPPKPKDQPKEPPRAFGGQDSVAFIIMTLLVGLNIGTKSYFKSLDDHKRMKELERENLSTQLENLKYQINPHFFMNTLNNIHALVDIDPEQAKYTIEVLSKLMRYVLYEGNKAMSPLQKELDFIRHYIDLMRIRYTDKVRIFVSLPSQVSDIIIPSLLFTTFVENAFKHGVSYQKPSFIEVSVRVDENLHEVEFLCVNSKKATSEDSNGGVGLQNAMKRLQLIYGKNGYDLAISETDEEYRLLLRLPAKQA